MGFFYMVLEQVYFDHHPVILLFLDMQMKRVGLGKKLPFILPQMGLIFLHFMQIRGLGNIRLV